MSSPLPEIRFPEELPICTARADIQQALRDNQVLIVCGDTGSGKTTQLPKMALQLERGSRGRLIGCTQPRRLAAVTVARRVAEEFGQPVGGLVGCQHRFERQISRDTRIKFMTDGILLAETRSDPLLQAYDTLIIDEAHERSLNIDLLLGMLHRILPRRSDLRLIVSSATLDAERFSDFYQNAPVIKVAGRLHPIDLRYREPRDDDPDMPRLVANAIDELESELRGDILVFLPGERAIRETAEALDGRRLPATEIIPLLASLPVAQQQRAFRLSANRRIILATNVAETSVTIPGIRYVVDSGTARISRYLHRTQVQRLQIEPISQASANQRAGRCGRVGPGVCIRLYGEDDFKRRDPYTDPEITRSSLAGVILAMLDLQLGDIENFPLIDAPSATMIRDGIRELEELGAVQRKSEDGKTTLTHLGRQLAQMPIEPRLARMLLAAHHEKALPEALVVVASLACDDPRRRPIEQQEEADRIHAAWKTPESDFAAILRLWRWWNDQTKGKSQSATRRLCQAHFLSYNKMREWSDLHGQLDRLCRRLQLDTTSDTGGDAGLHRALLAGLLGRIGNRDPQSHDYRGARGIRFSIFPGSGLFKRQPAWVMAGELVDTTRLYAREAAQIDPKWIEPLAGDLCSHSYHSPIWDGDHGFVRATEQVTLFGLVIVEGRRCDYTRIDPPLCRDLLIRHGLVAGDFPRPPPPLAANQELLASLRRREEKTRCLGQMIDEEQLVAFFDARIPHDVFTASGLRQWLRRATPAEREALRLEESDLVSDNGRPSYYPDSLQIGGTEMPLTYRHAYGDDDDGITCTATREQAALLRTWPSDWLVPGALPEKIRWMLGVLPATQRRALGDLNEITTRCLTNMRPGRGKLAEALAENLHKVCGVKVTPDAWKGIRIPPHLLSRFVVINDDGSIAASGRDLAAVLRTVGIADNAESATPATAASPWHKDGLTTWSCGDLPEEVDVGRIGWSLHQYPALQDTGEDVSLRLFEDAGAAHAAHRGGILRLLALALGREAAQLARLPAWPQKSACFLQKIGYPPQKLADDLMSAILSQVFLEDQPEIRTGANFDARLRQGSGRLAATQFEWRRLVTDVIAQAAERQAQLERETGAPTGLNDMRIQLSWLLFPSFIRYVPWSRLSHYPRYLDGLRVRLERYRHNAAGDARKLALVAPHWDRYIGLATKTQPPRHDRLELEKYRWMVEEFRISTFAQELRTAHPISSRRLDEQWERVMLSGYVYSCFLPSNAAR